MGQRSEQPTRSANARLRQYDSTLELVSHHRNLPAADRQVERVVAYVRKLGFHVQHSQIRREDGERIDAARERTAA